MKRFTKIILTLLLVLIMPCLAFVGCGEAQKYVVSIIKSSETARETIYTITYSDGTTDEMKVTNGEKGSDGANGLDGEDGKNLTIDTVFNRYKEIYGEISFQDFLNLYLSIEVDETATAVNTALLSSVKIYTEFYETVSSFFGTEKKTAIYSGSGVIYKMDEDYSYIITNYHVMYDANADEANGGKIAKTTKAYLYGSEGSYQATGEKDANGYPKYEYGDYAIDCYYVGGSIKYDLAVLRVVTGRLQMINPDVREIIFADKYFVGETAIAIGNTEDEGISATKGIISVDNEYINLQIDNTVRQYRSIRIDTAIYSGNSGGGLFDINGHLIGITNAGDSEDQNVNYAIPLPIVKAVVNNIMYNTEKGTTVNTLGKRFSLGVTVSSSNQKFVLDESLGYGKIKEDVVVTAVTENSIVDTLGLEINDKILSIFIGEEEFLVDRSFEIDEAILSARVDDTISIKYTRGSSTVQTSEYTLTSADFITFE